MSTEGTPYCRLVRLKSFKENDRGSLSFAEAGRDIPFAVKRVFWIYDVPLNATRGGHANWKCAEAIFPLHGAFDIYVDDGTYCKTYHMDNPEEGIVIPAGVWCMLSNFRPGTVCFVASDEEYSAEHYVNDYNEYLKQVKWK